MDINFSTPMRRRQGAGSSQTASKKHIPYPTSKEKETFFSTLQQIHPKSVILTTIFPQSLVETAEFPVKKLPKTIFSLCSEKYRGLNCTELFRECKRILAEELIITKGEADYLEHSTTLQSRSAVWFAHRKGRITASKFKDVCHTRIASPSKSVVHSILQRGPKVTSAAMEWGVKNEALAKADYSRLAETKHQLF